MPSASSLVYMSWVVILKQSIISQPSKEEMILLKHMFHNSQDHHMRISLCVTVDNFFGLFTEYLPIDTILYLFLRGVNIVHLSDVCPYVNSPFGYVSNITYASLHLTTHLSKMDYINHEFKLQNGSTVNITVRNWWKDDSISDGWCY